MADIQKLTYPYFTDGTTQLNAANLNPIIQKINEVIDKINGGVTPIQTVATPTIFINDTAATISCSTSGATIYYTLDGNTPTTSSTQYSSPITLSGACIIKAIAVKSGMNNSSVASQSYSPSADPVQTIVNKIKAKLSGVGNKETAVYNLLDALGASTPNSGIWSKIKALYIPCLAIPSDGGNVFYDIISDSVITESNSYQIEAKRGVMSTTVNNPLSDVSLSGISADNTSMFAIVTQRTDTTLGTSASMCIRANHLVLTWKKNGSSVGDATDPNERNITTGAITEFASEPETFVVSAMDGDSRSLITNEGVATGIIEFTTFNSYCLCFRSYAATSLFGLTDGLTTSEATTVSNAIKAFVTAYGIECVNNS